MKMTTDGKGQGWRYDQYDEPGDAMILGISGSPIPDGNTDRIVQAVLQRSGAKTDFVNLSGLKFDSCRACAHLCAATNICPLEDDLRPYFEPIRDAEAIILGTPIHAGLMTGWTYSFLTRLSCFSHVRHPLRSKPILLVITGCFAGSEEGTVPMVTDIVRRQTRGAKVIGHIFHATSIPPCFKCGEGNRCKVGGLWGMLGRDDEKLKNFEVTPESFTRWEDSAETVLHVGKYACLLADL
jgi:multimeric flavodoxin WrbA